MRRLGLLLIVASCGRVEFAPLPDAAPAQSRLAVRYDESADGVRIARALYDTQLGIECVLQDIDGALRCLPDAMPINYGDAACTGEVAVRLCGHEARYATRTTPDGRLHLYAAGAPRGTVPTYISQDASCTEWSTDLEVYDIGDEIPMTALATATTETTSTGARLDTVDYVDGNGFRAHAYLNDNQLGAQCDYGPVSPQPNNACIPFADFTFVSYSTDMTCSDHVAALDGAAPTRFLAWLDYTTCPLTEHHYYEAGAEIAAPLYSGTPASCSLSGTPEPGPYIVAGADLPLQLMTLEVDPPVAGNRMQTSSAVGGGIREPVGFVDSVVGDCYGQRMADGSMRCIPSSATITRVYSDNGCANQVLYGWWLTFGPTCGIPDFKYAIDPIGTNCAPVYDVYELGTEFTGQYWLKDQSNNCQGPFGVSASTKYWNVVRKLDPSELVEIHTVIE